MCWTWSVEIEKFLDCQEQRIAHRERDTGPADAGFMERTECVWYSFCGYSVSVGSWWCESQSRTVQELFCGPYTNSFIEGVVVAKKDFDAPKHDEIDTKNLFVIKALQSLTSKGYVKTQFSWQYYYYTLTDEGVEFLRSELNIPEGILPLTRLKGAPAERPQRASRGPRRDGDSYRRRARD